MKKSRSSLTLHTWQFMLAQRILQIMEEKELTQREFAKLARLTEAQVSALVHAGANPTLSVLARISAMLGSELLEWINTDEATYSADDPTTKRSSTLDLIKSDM